MDKVIKAEYNEKAGTSEVTLMTKWGTFTRTVKVHDDDKDIANKWDGCYFANYLCVIDKLKAKGNALIQRAKGIEHAATVAAQARYAEGYSHITEHTEFNDTLQILRRQAACLRRDGTKCLETARDMKKKYPEYVEKMLGERKKFMDSILSDN